MDTEPDTEIEEAKVLVAEALKKLGEHFDAVQIFACRQGGGTKEGVINIAQGLGNWYARYGQAREWLIIQDEGSRQRASIVPEAGTD